MAEHKYFITQDDFTGNTNSLKNVTLVPSGNTQISRIGDIITGTSLEVMMSWQVPQPNQNPISTTINWRWIGLIWKDDTTPTLATVLDPVVGLSTLFNPLRPLNHDLKVKRKVLWNKIWSSYGWIDFNIIADQYYTTTSNPRGTSQFVVNLTKYQRNKLNRINFLPGSTVGVNHIYSCIFTSEPAGNDSYSEAQSVFKYNFIDM